MMRSNVALLGQFLSLSAVVNLLFVHRSTEIVSNLINVLQQASVSVFMQQLNQISHSFCNLHTSFKMHVSCTFFLIFCSAFLVHLNSTENLALKKPPPHTSNDLEVGPLMGRWLQMYASLIPFMTYERSAYCVTSDYVLAVGPNQNTWAFNITVTQK